MRRLLFNLFALAVVAAGLPWYLGSALLSASVLIPLANLSIFLVADLAADSFAGLDSGNFVRRVGFCVLRGWSSGLAVIFAALLALNVIFRESAPLLPPVTVLIDALVLSLAASVLVAGITLTVCRKVSSPHSAKLVLKLILVTAILAVLYGCNKAQSEGWFFPTLDRITRLSLIAAAFLLVNGAALLTLASQHAPSKSRPSGLSRGIR